MARKGDVAAEKDSVVNVVMEAKVNNTEELRQEKIARIMSRINGVQVAPVQQAQAPVQQAQTSAQRARQIRDIINGVQLAPDQQAEAPVQQAQTPSQTLQTPGDPVKDTIIQVDILRQQQEQARLARRALIARMASQVQLKTSEAQPIEAQMPMANQAAVQIPVQQVQTADAPIQTQTQTPTAPPVQVETQLSYIFFFCYKSFFSGSCAKFL